MLNHFQSGLFLLFFLASIISIAFSTVGTIFLALVTGLDEDPTG
jgi:Na+/melibiose symporter-like transporter